MYSNLYEQQLVCLLDEVSANRLSEEDIQDAMLEFSMLLTACLPADVVQRDIHNLLS